MNPKRILIIQTAFLGDVVLTLPLLQVLRKNYSQAEIDFLCIPQTSGLLKNNPYVNEVIEYDKRNTGSSGFFGLLKKLKSKKYDLVISPHRSFRSALLSRFSFSGKTISFDKSAGAFLYDTRVKYTDGIHEIGRNLELLAPLGIDESEIIKPELFPGNPERDIVTEYLEEIKIGANDRMICIAPGSVWFTKRFPKEKFVRVCDILQNMLCKVVLIGGESDMQISNYILENTKNESIYDSTGKFSILESAELLRRSSLLITNDSAPLHIANAVGTRVISIFGATVPEFGFYPIGKDDVIIETKGLKCRPCSVHGGNKCPIRTFECMVNINERSITEMV